jgi:Ca2+:H+ antiporter
VNLKWFLLCVPAAFAASWMDTSPILVFCLSALAMIPLAQLMGDATEDLAHYLGPSAGGLLTATMGNIPDIIISIFALRHGLVEVVKASITGAIVGNLLLGVGLTCLLGGLKHRAGQTFDIKSSHLMSGLLLLSTIGLIIPAIFNFSTDSEKQISLEISVVLLVTYLSSVYFTLRNPQSEIQVPIISVPEEDQLDPTQRSFGPPYCWGSPPWCWPE